MIVCLIPARSGSKSIPDKNIKELDGKPLICWTIETALKCFERVIVSTDSEKYAKIAKEWGAEIMMRPSELAKDDTPMFAVLKSEIPKIEPLPEIVALLQPTTPFRKKVPLKMAVELLGRNEDYDSVIIAERVPEKYHPACVIVSTPLGLRMANGSPIYQRLTGRQVHPDAYVPQGTYFFRTKNLAGGDFYGKKTMVLETEPTININGPSDFEEAIEWLKNKK